MLTFCAVAVGAAIGLATAALRPVNYPMIYKPQRAVRPRRSLGKSYVVHAGDSLSSIALRETGDAQNWPALYEHNRGILAFEQDARRVPRGPDAIFEGTEIAIPVKLLRAA